MSVSNRLQRIVKVFHTCVRQLEKVHDGVSRLTDS